MTSKGQCRGFEEVKIFANPSIRRFLKPLESKAPRLAPYRNNLVALSQYHNLFFVAARDNILVYEPLDQEQALPDEPIHVVKLAGSGKNLNGYMDPANSHAINQLVVADLGFEEVVVAVCDDGDVVAYWTRSVVAAIENSRSDFAGDMDPVNEPRPFFVNNVGMSAWGVAVHKEARMIAVSSNSKKINIFVFALGGFRLGTPEIGGQEELFDLDSLVSSEEQEWRRPPILDALDPADRSRNLEIVLSSHWTNIPNIAFYNSRNPSSRDIYLVSTDIDGMTYIWNVWQRKVAVEITSSIEEEHKRRGWGVACIDPYFCHDGESSAELFGAPHVVVDEKPVNISGSVNSVPETSREHFTLRKSAPRPSLMNDSADEDVDMEDEFDQDFDDEDDLGLHDQSDHDDSGTYDPAEGDGPPDSETESTIAESLLSEIPVESPYNFDPSSTIAGFSDASNPPAWVPLLATKISQNQTNALGSATGPTSSHKTRPAVLPFHVLRTTQLDIFLHHTIQPYTDDRTNLSSTKTVYCCRPLHQYLTRYDTQLARLERLNMVLQIPELGILVIGDQMGRVALLTMTRCMATSKKSKDNKFGFRFERFLPLMSQEDENERPRTELLGVAVGPVARHLLKRPDGLCDEGYDYEHVRRREAWREFEGSRRYRVILYYRDHTVLSYEIGRRPRRKSDAPVI
ncbi:MAG: hypothetical protein LQ346_007429 [Caloplaca aetnensis]|nr:MAG: hypothetical protein LQ346_007429 [Caloplaca aetnensis]